MTTIPDHYFSPNLPTEEGDYRWRYSFSAEPSILIEVRKSKGELVVMNWHGNVHRFLTVEEFGGIWCPLVPKAVLKDMRHKSEVERAYDEGFASGALPNRWLFTARNKAYIESRSKRVVEGTENDNKTK